MRVTILDYGVGNLYSLKKALARSGAQIDVERDPVRAIQGDALILPGVGAFSAAAAYVARARETIAAAIRDGLPTLGICLGMQLLLEASDEGPGAGLAVFPGRVVRLHGRRVPQMGWNTIDDSRDGLFAAAPIDSAYYANSFVCQPDSDDVVTAWSTHDGTRFPAAIRAGNAVGVQFHPEKSSQAGVDFLCAFVRGIS
jgi:imidazole glycerol-phosphate synthase subunit HisH